MRYVAKIHVLDVMDQIIVSGYVYDADGPVRDGEPPLEFTYQVPGVGHDDPLVWLLNGLYRALIDQPPAGAAGLRRAGSQGVLDTISGSGDRRQDGVGWTVVGGAARGQEPVVRSTSDQH